jgi:putative ABC transport system ATP-binding protein
MILELEHVFKDYAQGKTPVPVLRDISMKVEEGEYLAIMGPSGSGKTTLMNVLGCLDVPTSGRYVLEGQDIGTLGDEALAHVRNKTIGFVFQNFHLLPTMTAKENVMLPLAYRGLPMKERKLRAEAALKLMGLGDRTDFYPNQLSGGQCQRVAIARAIAGNPRLILADEPTGALDTAAGEQIMEIFRRLSQRGITIIMITHEPHIARCADRILRIRDGQLVEDADTAEKEAALT